jgi:hypothetical protein
MTRSWYRFRVSVRPVLFFAASVLAMSACSLLTSLDGLTGGASAEAGDGAISADAPLRSDASGADVAVQADGAGADGGGDSGPSNLVADPGFESGAVGCGGVWSGGYNATYQLSPEAHTGSNSCLMCPAPGGVTSFALALTNPLTLGPGSYVAAAWIHAPVDAGGAGGTGVLPAELLPDGGTVFHQGTMVTPDVVWASSTESFTLAETTQLSLSVHVYFPNGGCVLIDDVSLVQQ